jgi:hypothetical protein
MKPETLIKLGLGMIGILSIVSVVCNILYPEVFAPYYIQMMTIGAL